MAKTPSTMLELNTTAPDFSLLNIDGKIISKQSFSEQPLLVMFLSNHCPFVKHVREKLIEIGKLFLGKKIAVVAINSNDTVSYPEDSFEKMKLEGYSFPYLFDESQEIAKRYKAACTPDFFLFNSSHSLVYRGQLDDSRPGSKVPVSGRDLLNAAEAMLASKEISATQKPSLGCNIKWKAGNAPSYYQP